MVDDAAMDYSCPHDTAPSNANIDCSPATIAMKKRPRSSGPLRVSNTIFYQIGIELIVHVVEFVLVLRHQNPTLHWIGTEETFVLFNFQTPFVKT